MRVFITEDNLQLQQGLVRGFDGLDGVSVVGVAANSDDTLNAILDDTPDVVVLDVELRESTLNGVQTAVALRREIPRLPVVFYSIADDDAYYRDFLNSGILSHYAYVRKGNYLLPQMLRPLLRDAIAGRSFIDPDIEARVQAIRHRDADNPLDLLEPNELAVIDLIAKGMTNGQIAEALGLRDARAVARTNGQIYTAWGLNNSTTDEKVARTRAALIFARRRMIVWDDAGTPSAMTPGGEWVAMQDAD